MKRLTFLAVVALAATPVLGDWFPADGHKMHWPQLPDPLGWDVNATFPKVLADDWQCSGTGPVQDIHFWGSWKGDVVGQITSFHLSIHADIPAGGGVPYSRPGQELWSFETTSFVTRPIDPPSMEGWFDPNTGVVLPNDHTHYFQYNVMNIPMPYIQTAGTIYWLDISAHVAPGPAQAQWGWKSTPASLQFNDDAVWGDFPAPAWVDLHNPLAPTQSLDLAFVITPEPASLALLALGAMMLRRRR